MLVNAVKHRVIPPLYGYVCVTSLYSYVRAIYVEREIRELWGGLLGLLISFLVIITAERQSVSGPTHTTDGGGGVTGMGLSACMRKGFSSLFPLANLLLRISRPVQSEVRMRLRTTLVSEHT